MQTNWPAVRVLHERKKKVRESEQMFGYPLHKGFHEKGAQIMQLRQNIPRTPGLPALLRPSNWLVNSFEEKGTKAGLQRWNNLCCVRLSFMQTN